MCVLRIRPSPWACNGTGGCGSFSWQGSMPSFLSGSTHRRLAGPYPERHEAELCTLDRVLIEAYAAVALRFEQGAKALVPRAIAIERRGAEVAVLSDDNLRQVAQDLRG